MTETRVAVTGLGVVSPIGTGADEFWNAMMEGRSGVRRLTAFDPAPFESQLAAEVLDFDPAAYLDRKEVRRNDRCVHFAVAASRMALDDAGLAITPALRDDVGVVIGTGSGGAITWEAQHQLLLERGPARVSPFFVPMMMHNSASGIVSMLTGARGPNFSIASACATGGHAIGEAMRIIQRGDALAMLCGGTEAAITPLSLAGFCAEKALSTRNDAPAKAVRPFDLHRDGFVMGEGAGIVVLEAWEHAERRGARIYAEMIGYGQSADAFHITQPDPEGDGAALAMRRALRDAHLEPHEIGYINAHGTSTQYNDKFETLAIKRVFGAAAPRIPVSSTKSMTGHLLGAAGGVELIACALAIVRGKLPPTINYETPDPDCDLDYVPNTPRPARLVTAMSNGFGFGGHNSILVVRSPS
ncbi:MAG TPA: beta-ketoacyl-ACP synthase II [bacterium]|nr:beta-ketoacyl-ACP synthase II [bacterium]